MPLKLSTGIARKLGQPNFGSLQASCFVELELSSDVIDDHERLRQQVRLAFRTCEEAVDEQLDRQTTDSPSASHIERSANGHPNDQSTSNGNGQTGQRSTRLATASQLRAVRAIAGKHRLDLPGILRQRFSVDTEEKLSISSASQLIDLLKSEAGEVVR